VHPVGDLQAEQVAVELDGRVEVADAERDVAEALRGDGCRDRPTIAA